VLSDRVNLNSVSWPIDLLTFVHLQGALEIDAAPTKSAKARSAGRVETILKSPTSASKQTLSSQLLTHHRIDDEPIIWG
jgi:hypothetical protein